MLLIFISIVLFQLWYLYPFAVLIEYRIEAVGAENMVKAYDQLEQSQTPLERKFEEIPLHQLPENLRLEGVSEAILRKEGLYLLLRRRFVGEDYLLIRSRSDFPAMISSGDPSFSKLKHRIWLVEIKG